MTVCGLLNGMLGGTILILPLVGLKTGYMTTFVITSFIGFISYYTAKLIVVHLGNARNMKECILNHFDHDYSYLVGYSVILWTRKIPSIILYFKLICLQIEGLIGHKE
jgi:amino acid permease